MSIKPGSWEWYLVLAVCFAGLLGVFAWQARDGYVRAWREARVPEHTEVVSEGIRKAAGAFGLTFLVYLLASRHKSDAWWFALIFGIGAACQAVAAGVAYARKRQALTPDGAENGRPLRIPREGDTG